MTHKSKNRVDGRREILPSPGHEIHETPLKGGFSHHPLATLSGTGSLHSSTGEVGTVRYHLPVLQAHGTQAGEGFITGDENLLRETYMDSEHTLQISDGRRIPILLTRLSSNGAEFRTNGPIPGF